ncbi:4-hydroxythreonine-4-phosphate dehydrogenase PdxA [Vannielia litorea]|uniref:4-hydroxythreonine-4-phosphate dehydrogenase PdxA n=1 Tax=Vannielia litorea TaxID=1217970 RepID=UPI001C96BB2E|nr:4-hydroxythreonine-4-phosphate dehydrogenase PdxA [Vannielia litorea]MBY6047710.1 4-hydroxythreonine-4-phosphate dehydrogenase PdxA [Vannielia litorea]MBY6075124.1 4-hydroxythreonine-4-phosphate dehydrogenase PdxA [Vannielia litorea]
MPSSPTPERSGPPPAAIALSCGDPAGIGPEIAVKAWKRLGATLPFAYIGARKHLPAALPVQTVANTSEAAEVAGEALPLIEIEFPGQSRPGQPDPEDAAAVIAAITRAVDEVKSGHAAALTTCPISKLALIEGAGFAFPGHTEFLAHLAGGTRRPVMMLASEALRCVPVTIHIPLADVPEALTPGLLTETIRITVAALRRDFGIVAPRLAVAGLNPHAGEGGKIGSEELDWIEHTLDDLRAEGLALSGPLPADTMFHAAARARYDAAIAMYHDQALIPAKTLAFDTAVNVTLGLPFIRTSPDHGTAYDIAGQDLATPASLCAALEMARRMATARASHAPD